jgi:hypothetical protein
MNCLLRTTIQLGYLLLNMAASSAGCLLFVRRIGANAPGAVVVPIDAVPFQEAAPQRSLRPLARVARW